MKDVHLLAGAPWILIALLIAGAGVAVYRISRKRALEKQDEVCPPEQKNEETEYKEAEHGETEHAEPQQTDRKQALIEETLTIRDQLLAQRKKVVGGERFPWLSAAIEELMAIQDSDPSEVRKVLNNKSVLAVLQRPLKQPKDVAREQIKEKLLSLDESQIVCYLNASRAECDKLVKQPPWAEVFSKLEPVFMALEEHAENGDSDACMKSMEDLKTILKEYQLYDRFFPEYRSEE